MTASKTMDVDLGHVTEQMLNLTLEIIYLLTGEDYILVKTSGLCVISRNHPFGHGKFGMTQSSMMAPPTFSLESEKNNMQKVLEVTNKIIELLTEEVPIRCQDVSVYFSMEEWDYLEAHRDLYKDVMMENEPPLTSPDGSSKRNPPERCPRSLYSRDSTQEDHEIPQTRPLYSQDSTQEHHEIPHQDQDGLLIDIKVEDSHTEDKTHAMSGWPHKSGDISPEFQTAGVTVRGLTSEDLLDLFPKYGAEDETVTRDSPAGNVDTPDFHLGLSYMLPNLCYAEEPYRPDTGRRNGTPQGIKKFPCPECGKSFSKNSALKIHCKRHVAEKPFSCPECGNCFRCESELIKHHRTHVAEKRFPCMDCGISFMSEPELATHQRIHSVEKSYVCAECGKSFEGKRGLRRHYKSHSSNKPHPCLECGKRYTWKSELVQHQRVHTGEKPFSCLECGKSFSWKAVLLKHQKVHSGGKSLSCPQCGECFTWKSDLDKHQRKAHTGERTLSCTECGKRYTSRSHLLDHQRTHTGEKPFSCPQCERRFTSIAQLNKHRRSHTCQLPFSCSECGKCFTERETLVRHQRVHKMPFSWH